MGFLSSSYDCELLANSPEKFAKGIARGICEFLGFSFINELTEINDIVWELWKKGIITDKNLWLCKLASDKDTYWLARKIANNR